MAAPDDTGEGDLVARTTRLDGSAFDALSLASSETSLWLREGAGLVAWGEVARVDLPAGIGAEGAAAVVQEALESIVIEGAPGAPLGGPIAIGAIPFDRTAPCALSIPAQIIRVSPGFGVFRTTIGAGHTPPWAAPSCPAGRTAERITLTSTRPDDAYRALVERAALAIARGELEKVVLAREVILEADQAFDAGAILRRLAVLHPACTIFHHDGFLGASPELLVAREGRDVSSHPLAGTRPASGDPAADRALAARLLESDKDRREHRVVVDAIASALAPLCDSLEVPPAPSVMTLRNVMHLGTQIRGRLAEPAPSALALAARLHPTPAVCGAPRDAAAAWIAANEGLERDRYAGAVGWVDARGDGAWVVGLRCAELAGRRARLIAGAGIVAGSDPEAELAETQHKLQAMLAALRRP